jgi:hypothetical protein
VCSVIGCTDAGDGDRRLGDEDDAQPPHPWTTPAPSSSPTPSPPPGKLIEYRQCCTHKELGYSFLLSPAVYNVFCVREFVSYLVAAVELAAAVMALRHWTDWKLSTKYVFIIWVLPFLWNFILVSLSISLLCIILSIQNMPPSPLPPKLVHDALGCHRTR